MQEKIGLTLDLRGIDMVTPVDLLSDGHTPWSKNFRLYAQQADDRQVAVSSRKGPGFYVKPRTEAVTDSVDGADSMDLSIGVTSHIFAQKVVMGTSGRLNRFDAKLRNFTSVVKSKGAIILSIYTVADGKPSKLLSQSSFDAGDIGDTYEWHTARFHNAPLLSQNDEVFAVFEIQDDGEGIYQLSGNSTDTGSMYSEVSLAAMEPVGYSANFRAYVAPNEKPKGAIRYNRLDGTNFTLAVYGSTMYTIDKVTNTWTVLDNTLNPLASEYSFTIGDNKVFWVNGFDGLKYWDGTNPVVTITDVDLPVLSQIAWHKLRLFGVPANSPSALVFSEGVGNPPSAAPELQWYRAWRSTDRAVFTDPVTGLVSFQDSLVVFTQNTKYIFSGSDRGNFTDRQSTGAKGALSPRGIAADENYIYFVSDDGFYRFNGSSDENITEKRIQPLFDACPRPYEITPIIWKNRVRWYMASKASAVNDMCAILAPGLGDEWELDVDTFIDRAIYYRDADDDRELVEFSSHYAMPMLAEQNYHSLGAPIDFEYRLKYDSFGVPAQKKRLRRYFPIMQGVDNTFKLNLMMDKDFEDNPRIKEVLLSVQGSTWGGFNWGDGTLWGGDKSFKHHRQSYPGSAYYWQLRVARKGVNNRVAFIGSQYKYRIKRM